MTAIRKNRNEIPESPISQLTVFPDLPVRIRITRNIFVIRPAVTKREVGTGAAAPLEALQESLVDGAGPPGLAWGKGLLRREG